MDDIRNRLNAVREDIRLALADAGRTDGVTLVAVSKTVAPDRILAAYHAGQRVFGENRVQEAVQKVADLETDMPDAEWHLIGHLQTNKAKAATRAFSMIESVDSLHLAARLSREAEQTQKTLPVLLEVNVAGEESKSGFSLESLLQDFAKLQGLGYLRIHGLMTVAPLVEHPEFVRPVFRRLRELRDRIAEEFEAPNLTELSMGMSNDFREAVKEGATIIRLGRAIFGERPP